MFICLYLDSRLHRAWCFSSIMSMACVIYAEVVEFQQSNDRRTGKPIAVAVIRAPVKASCEIISEKPATGVVLAEAKAVKNSGVCVCVSKIFVSILTVGIISIRQYRNIDR